MSSHVRTNTHTNRNQTDSRHTKALEMKTTTTALRGAWGWYYSREMRGAAMKQTLSQSRNKTSKGPGAVCVKENERLRRPGNTLRGIKNVTVFKIIRPKHCVKHKQMLIRKKIPDCHNCLRF